MREDGAQEANHYGFAGHLMCAVPQLLDTNFHRAVVLLVEHGPHGATGLCLQNPLPTTLHEIATALELTWQGPADHRVRLGGPVEPMRGWILHDQPTWDDASSPINTNLHLTTSLDLVLRRGNRCFGADEANFLFVLGHAGWGPGQLEDEVMGGCWVFVPIGDRCGCELDRGLPTEWLFRTDPAVMWRSALLSLGIEPERLVGLHGATAQ